MCTFVCMRAHACVCCLFTIQQQQIDPGFGVSVITDSEETLEENIQAQQIHANAHCCIHACEHTPQYMDA